MSSDVRAAPGERRTAARWFPILALVFCATLINYLDRTVFNIARPLFVKDLGMSAIVAGTRRIIRADEPSIKLLPSANVT